jgi:hypothetical protein
VIFFALGTDPKSFECGAEGAQGAYFPSLVSSMRGPS